MILTELLKDYRAKHKLSIRAMAATIGIEYSALYRFERGRAIQHDTFGKILRWLTA